MGITAVTAYVVECDECGDLHETKAAKACERYEINGYLTELAALKASWRDGWDHVYTRILCPDCLVPAEGGKANGAS